MTNILNKLGYASRPVIIGAALGIAAVALSVGVFSRFTGGGKKAAVPALEQYADAQSSGQNSSKGFSKEELEASMAAAELARSQNGSYGALKSAAGDNSDAGKAAKANASANGGAEAVNAQGLQGGGLGGLNTSGGINAIAEGYVAGDGGAAQAAPAQAEAAGNNLAAAAALKSAGGSRPATAVGQLTASNRLSGGGSSGKSGGSGASAGLSGARNSEAVGAKVPQGAAAKLEQSAGMEGSKGGRGSTMGGSNISAGGGSGGAGQQNFTVMSDLSTVSSYSKQAAGAKYGDESKGLAEAAFHGGEGQGGGIKVESGLMQAQRGASMDAMASTIGAHGKFGAVHSKFDNKDDKECLSIECQLQKAADLKKKIKNKMWWMFGIGVAATVAMVGLAFLPWPWSLVAMAGTLLTTMGIFFLMMMAGDNSIFGLLEQISNIGPYSGVSAAELAKIKKNTWQLFGLMMGLMGSAFILGPILVAGAIVGAGFWAKSIIGKSGVNKTPELQEEGLDGNTGQNNENNTYNERRR